MPSNFTLPPFGPRVVAELYEKLGEPRARLTSERDLLSTGADPREVLAVVHPESVEEVQTIVCWAAKSGIPLHPISRGCNWGLGSRSPARTGAVTVNLSRLNKIREINTEFGFAVVEPGVTQGQLAEALIRLGARYTVDVTGSGASSSLVGNAMERGVAYHTQRTETVRGLEVVLGDGSLYRTGFGREGVELLDNLYTHGVGPDPTGLFFQSGLGIVTAMTIDLLPITEESVSLTINLPESQVPDLVERLRPLIRDGVIDGIPHLANRERFYSTAIPLAVRASGGKMSAAKAEAVFNRLFPHPWTMIARVAGARAVVRARAKFLRQALRGLGKVRVTTEAQMKFYRRISSLLPNPLTPVLAAFGELNALQFGRPTDGPLGFLDHGTGIPPSDPPKDPDLHPRGFYYVLPIMPLGGRFATRMLEAIARVGQDLGLVPAVTLNVLNARVLEAVISVTFDKAVEDDRQVAVKFCERLLDLFPSMGAYPYRAHVDQLAQVYRPSEAAAAMFTRIKDALDPAGILSPGRYQPPAPSRPSPDPLGF